jgi:conjugal transfer mating pair stabilization protein TraG
MFEIYSIGDAAYLAAVLNAVAMLSGTGNMAQLAGVGFLIGVILVTFQGLVQARAPQFQQILIALVVYLGMFGPTARVSVEDLYSGAVRTVDNVPLGVAAVGSALSQVGYGVTRLFEQAFSTPHLTDYGFAAPLQVLQGVRKGTLSKAALGAANSPTPGADVERSFVNYIAECTLYAVDIGQRSIESILRDPSWTSAFETSLQMPTTELWLGGDPVVEECDDAWADLSAYVTTEFTPALRRSLAATLSLSEAEVDTTVQSSLDAIAGAGVDAQNYMIMAVAAGFLPKGEAQVYAEIGHWDAAAMITQAAQQRNTQWAAEETLFARIVRPMMTFFEAFLFAVSPLMVFAVGLGTVGIRMIGKYLLFGLWVQLWQPILAVVNLYILMTMQGKLDALRNAGLGNLELPSLYALWKLDFLLSDYLGVGGMLAASTPAIALMLIYGSAITATHLAGRLQGGDHINEKAMSPDALTPAPALSMGPIRTHAPLTGTTAPNANSVLWTADVGRSTQASLRSSEQVMEQASLRFASSLASAASATASRSGETFDSRAQRWDYAATGSATDRTLMSEAQGLAQRYEQSGLSQQQMAAVIAGAAGIPGSIGGGEDAAAALKGTLSSQLRSQYGVNQELSDAIAGDIAKRVTQDAGFEARLAESIKADSESGSRNIFAERLTNEDSSRMERDAGDLVSASRSLEREQSLAHRYGAMGTFGAAEIGNAIGRNPALMERLNQEIDRRNLTGDHQRLSSAWNYASNLSPEAARAAAGVALLIGHADGETLRRFTPSETQAAREAGYALLADAFGTHSPSIDPGANADLLERAPAYGDARGVVDGVGLRDPRGAAARLGGSIEAHRGLVERQYDPSAVDRFQEAAQAGASDRFEAEQARLREERRDQLGATIDERAILPRSTAQGVHNELGGLLVQMAESGVLVRAGAAAAVDQTVAALKTFGTTLSSGAGLGAALQAGRDAAGGAPGWADARAALIEARIQQIAGYGLTDAQQTLFREATDSLFAAGPSAAQQAARQAVIVEAGQARGQHIADLIERSAASRDDTDLRLIGNYNTQAAPAEKKTEQEAQDALSDGPSAFLGPVGGPADERILDLIAQAESQGNYNAWYGDAGQGRIDLSRLTLDQVRDLQRDLVRQNGGSAIGRYQIIDDTLEQLRVRLGLTGGERFTPQLQDRLGLVLARDAGLDRWQRGRLSDAQFAYNLSQVWAGLPKDATNQSFYEGTAGNRATLSYTAVMGALNDIRRDG